MVTFLDMYIYIYIARNVHLIIRGLPVIVI